MLTFIKNEPALYIKQEEKIILIPDLHLGFEREFLHKGINIPSQTIRILDKVENIVMKYKPNRLIFLGDIKHGTFRILLHEWKEIPEFFGNLLALVKRIEIIPGNHDGGLRSLLPKEVIVHPVKGVVLKVGGKIISLTHGHAWPIVQALASDTLIMAHHHFTVELKETLGLKMVKPVWVISSWNKRKIAESFLKAQGFNLKEDPLMEFQKNYGFDVGNPTIIVMPTFNPMLGGWAINSNDKKAYLGPLYKSGAIDISGSNIYLLDGTFLGKLSDLKHLRR